VRQHRLVGLEDLRVLVGVAVELLGDLRQRVALDHGVVLRFVGRRRDGHHVVHVRHTLDVAAAQHHLLLGGLVGRHAGHGHGAAAAVEGNVQAIDFQVHRVDVGGDRIARGVIEPLDVGCARVTVGRLLRGLGFAFAEQFLASLLDERDQTHENLLSVVDDGEPDCTPVP
jgi:hypothetical protein